MIIENDNESFVGKVLVLFEENLDKLGLQNHNPLKNTLWILLSDLEITND